MHKLLFILATVFVLTACGNSSDGSANSDSTSNSNNSSLPSQADTSVMGRRMGDTTVIMGDSTK